MPTTIPDDLIGLAEAAALLPSRKPGRKLHVTTLYRWIHAGELAGWRIGGCWFCSRADILAIPARAAASEGLTTAGDRQSEQEEAKQALADAGWM